MKLSFIAVTAVSLAPVHAYLQSLPFHSNELTRQALFRRNSPLRSRPTTGEPGRAAAASAPEQPSGWVSQLSTGASARPRARRAPPQIPSDGDSDSSADDPHRRGGAKVKVTVAGPAHIRTDRFSSSGLNRSLQPGERYKKSFYDKHQKDVTVTTQLGGEAKVTTRGRKSIATIVKAGPGGSGSITPIHPERTDPIIVPSGTAERQDQRSRRGALRPGKFSSNMNGPGQIYAEADNGWESP